MRSKTHQDDTHFEEVVGNQLIVDPFQESIRADAAQLVEGDINNNVVDHTLDQANLHENIQLRLPVQPLQHMHALAGAEKARVLF